MSEPTSRARRWADRENRRRARSYGAALAAWQQDDRVLAAFVAQATDGPVAPPHGFVVKRNEHVVQVLPNVHLVECVRTPGHYQSVRAGFSYQVSKNLRYSVGGSRRQYVPGPEELKVRDTGTAVVTSQRVVFQGGLKSREWAFGKLLGYAHDERSPYTALHVSNRQNVSGLQYDAVAAPLVHFSLALALAAYAGEVPALVTALQAERAALAAARPVPPPMVSPEEAPKPSLLNALRVAYTGRPEYSTRRRVTQAALLGMLTIGVVNAAVNPQTENAASSAPAREPVVATTPPPSPSSPSSPVAVPPARPTTAAPAVRPTTVPPVARPTTVAPVVRPPAPKPTPTRTTPAPKPVAASTCGAPANPWGYNFCGRGSFIRSAPAEFCSYFDCIASFWESTNGYVMQCDDGMYSHSGGRQGSCSHHGGNNRPLYG